MLFEYRHTKIIFTIGPATENEEVLEQLIFCGVDACRLNMAHLSHEWTRTVIQRIGAVCNKVGRHIAILMDIKGPEIRTGDLSETLYLEKDEIFDFTTQPRATDTSPGNSSIRSVEVNYPDLVKDMAVGSTILVDNGRIRFEVYEKDDTRIRCKVITPGPLESRRHINLPGTKVNLPSLTSKDFTDIKVGIEAGVDLFALSFVREAEDLHAFRRHLTNHRSQAKIIAKIEDQSAITNLDEIITASDGLMVARGDLGVEVPYEQLPIIQRRAVNACLSVGKPVVITTHMLESMVASPMPTRAEITDISNAVEEQADCVMLSAETAIGKYPVECVKVLNRIIAKIEDHHSGRDHNEALQLKTPKAKLRRAAVVLADELSGAGIVIFERSGVLSQMLSSLRPCRSPIFAFTDVPAVFKHSLILWGIEPFLIEFSEDPEETIQNALNRLKQAGWVKEGEMLVVITDVLVGERIIDTIQLRVVE